MQVTSCFEVNISCHVGHALAHSPDDILAVLEQEGYRVFSYHVAFGEFEGAKELTVSALVGAGPYTTGLHHVAQALQQDSIAAYNPTAWDPSLSLGSIHGPNKAGIVFDEEFFIHA